MKNAKEKEACNAGDVELLLKVLQKWKNRQWDIYTGIKRESSIDDTARYSEKGYYNAMRDVMSVIRRFFNGVLDRGAEDQFKTMAEEGKLPLDFKKTLKDILEEEQKGLTLKE